MVEFVEQSSWSSAKHPLKSLCARSFLDFRLVFPSEIVCFQLDLNKRHETST